MKQEILKKIIELADGFAYDDSLKAFYLNGDTWVWFKEIDEWEFYPLLLRRAVEEYNNNHKVYKDIHLCAEHLIFTNKDIRTQLYFKNYPKTDYLTPQEQAIEACLIELLEDK